MTKSILKNSLLILMGLVVLTFTSCEKDSDTTPEPEVKVNKIIGTWTIESTSVELEINDLDLIQYFIQIFGLSQAEAEYFATEFIGSAIEEDVTGTASFKEDGSYTMITNGETQNGTYKMSDDNSKMTMDEDTADEIIFDIITLTSTKLEFSFTETEVDDFDEDGTADTLKINVSMVLTK